MYRFIHPMPYQWSVVHEDTMVNPYFLVNKAGKIHLQYVDLLDADGRSRGIWHQAMMPHDLIAAFCRYIQEWHTEWEYLAPQQTQGLTFDINFEEGPK